MAAGIAVQALAFVAALSVSGSPPKVLRFDLGISCGLRTISGSLKSHGFGGGSIWSPRLGLGWGKGLTVGFGIEDGFRVESAVGEFKDKAILRVSGAEFDAGYEFRKSRLALFARIGLGLYRYRYDLGAELETEDIDRTASAVLLGCGAKISIFPSIYFGAAVKYVPLEVRPFDLEVDLSGFRFLFGVGWEPRLRRLKSGPEG